MRCFSVVCLLVILDVAALSAQVMAAAGAYLLRGR
jgi:hypothetical protein